MRDDELISRYLGRSFTTASSSLSGIVYTISGHQKRSNGGLYFSISWKLGINDCSIDTLAEELEIYIREGKWKLVPISPVPRLLGILTTE